MFFNVADLTQLVECYPCKLEVVGSSPTISTKYRGVEQSGSS